MKALRFPRVRPSHAFVLSAGYCLASMAMAQVSSPEITSDASTVYYKVPYSGTPGFIRVFVDNDRNISTGFNAFGVGSGYLVENGNLYRYSGSNGSWAWTFIKRVPYATVNGVASFSVARADLSSPSSIDSVAQVASPTYTSTKISTTLASTTTATAPAPTTTTTTSPTTTTTAPAPTTTTTTTTAPAPTTTTTSPTPNTSSSASVSYNRSNATFPNPDRGFHYQTDCANSAMSVSQLQNYRSQNISVILCSFNLSDAVNSPISQAKLDMLQRQMDTARTAGAKLMLRFVYNNTDNAIDAPLTQMLAHMDQVKPYIQNNKDVVMLMQAGFVGSWGEWGNSKNYGTGSLTSQNWADRKTIMNKMLEIMPSDRMIQLRTPDFKYKLIGTSALSASEAFNGSAKARVGHFNDCFLSSSNDWGTYNNTSVDFPFMEQDTKYLPMGGETCAVYAPRTDCPSAQSEMARFHWSYINAGYNTSVLNNWRSQGCYTTIEQKLGYRFVLQNASLSTSAKPGGSFTVNLNLVNEGFAAPFNPRPVQLVLRNNSSGTVHRVTLSADPRQWLPGQTINVNETVTLPSNMESGNYSVLLALPDASSSIANRPEYSIQLANSNTWEANTGFNNLNHTASIAP